MRAALKGWFSHDNAMGALLAARTGVQRHAIAEAYTSLYKRDLVKVCVASCCTSCCVSCNPLGTSLTPCAQDIEAKTMGDFRDLLRVRRGWGGVVEWDVI